MGGRVQPGPRTESVILLDTHVLIWLRSGDRRLGSTARREIDQALELGDAAASSISFWEVALLAERRRIELDLGVGEWRQLMLREGLVEIPVDGEIAIRAASLEGLRRDPADRLIVATALEGHQLMTADRQILDWPGPLRRLDATEKGRRS